MPKRHEPQVEWIGGYASLHTIVFENGKAYVPAVLIWMNTEGLVLGMDVGGTSEILGRAAQSLKRTIERPQVPSKPPSRVRVDDPDLYEHLKDRVGPVEVVRKATPEVTAVLQGFKEHLETMEFGEGGFAGEAAEADEDGELLRDRIALALNMLDHLLLERFEDLGLALDVESRQAVSLLMSLSAQNFGLPLVVLSSDEVRQLVFELMPKQVEIVPDDAGDLIRDLRDFFKYLGSEFGSEVAEAGTEALRGRAVSNLRAAIQAQQTERQPSKAKSKSKSKAKSKSKSKSKVSAGAKKRSGKPGHVEPPPDVDARRLEPIPVHDQGEMDSEALLGSDSESSFGAWFDALRDRGLLPAYEMDSLIPGWQPSLFGEDDPILQAVELRAKGQIADAQSILVGLLEREPRCLDAYAHLGNMAFQESQPKTALAHYELGVRIGDRSLAIEHDFLLPWGLIGNRPFLRCLHGTGLSQWRLGRWKAAEKTLTRCLRLNPSDNQGVRFLLPDVQARRPWRP